MRVFGGLWREWSLHIDTHHFTSIKSLWKNTQQRGNISRLWGEMLRSHRGRKTNETLLCNHLQSKGKRMKYRSEMTFENNSPNEQFLSNSFPLSVPRQPRSSYMSARGSWEWAHSQKQQSSHKKEVPQSPRFGVTRQGICGCFSFNPVPISLSVWAWRGRARIKPESFHECLVGA